MRLVECKECVEEIGNKYKVLVRKPEGKRSLGRQMYI
jgi:hypothetical protein